jgi:hypothetical protein
MINKSDTYRRFGRLSNQKCSFDIALNQRSKVVDSS